MKIRFFLLGTTLLLILSAWIRVLEKPTLYLVGDSTVAHGSGNNGLWGWGKYLGEWFDPARIMIENRAVGGTSSRTYLTNGVWNKDLLKNGLWNGPDGVMASLKPGDYVLLQFGHNDASPVLDTARARGSIKGIGDETQAIFNPVTKQDEVVHTYGWYMTKLIAEVKSKGAIPIVCSPTPRNIWKDGKVVRNTTDYGKWAAEVATRTGAYFIDLNGLIADAYEEQGEEKVKAQYFGLKDNTHTLEPGAKLNAACVAKGIRQLKSCPLQTYLIHP
ncbi:rhamnogalacturonan acetylesterase (plasmid) [Spirosoma sp. SC4-14]|uniref:rhamnogalacturonan acetylesterase n=1 Tax=Spirosoma sp. SC4-14 TaxID=3128900 RepID=UPI0030D3392D